jgi:hypothetical protein
MDFYNEKIGSQHVKNAKNWDGLPELAERAE